MERFHVIAFKNLNNTIFDTITNKNLEELKTFNPNSEKAEVLMYEVTPSRSNVYQDLVDKYGDHYQFVFINSHAKEMLESYHIPLNIIDEIELPENPIDNGYTLMIRNTRFV